MPHLSSESLLDLAERSVPDHEWPAHLTECVTCQQQLVELRAVLNTVAAVKVPDPSPLFWEHLSNHVREAVAAEAAPRRFSLNIWHWWRVALPAAAVVVALMAVAITFRPASGPSGAQDQDAVRTAQASPDEALSSSETVSWTLMSEIAAGVDWDTVVEAGLVPAAGDVDRALYDLSADERRELHRLLTEELAGSTL